jgi:hypothetical protein
MAVIAQLPKVVLRLKIKEGVLIHCRKWVVPKEKLLISVSLSSLSLSYLLIFLPDTEGTFRPERIMEIAERFGVDPDQACENIAYARAQNSEVYLPTRQQPPSLLANTP